MTTSGSTRRMTGNVSDYLAFPHFNPDYIDLEANRIKAETPKARSNHMKFEAPSLEIILYSFCIALEALLLIIIGIYLLME